MDIPFSQDTLARLNNLLMDVPYRYAASIVNLVNHQIQIAHENAADARDQMSGATPAPDEARGD